MKYESPKYFDYEDGNYYDLTIWKECENVGLYNDCHTADCCRHCGGLVIDFGSGTWINPIYEGFLFWKTELVKGYWKLKAKDKKWIKVKHMQKYQQH